MSDDFCGPNGYLLSRSPFFSWMAPGLNHRLMLKNGLRVKELVQN